MTRGDDTPIAFLFPAFPVLHQTFVLWEVVALRKLGVSIELYSIKRPDAREQQPEGREIAAEVHYLPGALSRELWSANLRTLARHPRRYLGACARLVREWWTDLRGGAMRARRSAKRDPAERTLSTRERLRMFTNTSPSVYLLRSLALVPKAVYLGCRLRRKGIERVHAHWATYSTTMALAISWIFDIPFSFTAHAYDIYLIPLLLPVKVREARFVVTCAYVNARYLDSLAGAQSRDRLVVNYHGVDLDRFRPSPRPARHARPCVVTCGSLLLYKGHHVLLQACARMQHATRCVIIGDGPQRGALQRQADALGIADRVELTGSLPQGELVRLYGEADVFVLASIVIERSGRRDVIPNVLVEAMAMGLPVVASDVSGIPELIDDRRSGRLVPPNDPQALAAVLDELLEDEEQRRRLGAAGLEKVRADFDRSTNIRELAKLFL